MSEVSRISALHERPGIPGTWPLLDGEHILWSGRPHLGLLLYPGDAVMIPFSLMWCGFAIFWEVGVFFGGAPFFFWLWGIPFVLVGLYLVAGRFVHDAWVRRETRYAVTNRRVLMMRAGSRQKLTTLDLAGLPELSLSQRADGQGTIRFGQPVPRGSRGGTPSWPSALDPTPQFIAIENAQKVFDLIQEASRNAR